MKTAFVLIMFLCTSYSFFAPSDIHPIVDYNRQSDSEEAKSFCCSGATACIDGEKVENSCQAPRIMWEDSAKKAVKKIVFNCEVALNLGGKGCKDGGFCCKKGTVECDKKPEDKDCP